MGWMTGVQFPVGAGIFLSLPPHPEGLWGWSSLLSNEYSRIILQGCCQGMELTIHLHLVMRSRMCGAIYLHSPRKMYPVINNAPHYADMEEWSYSSTNFQPWGKSTRYPLDRRLGGSQSQSATRGKEKNLCSCQKLNPGLPAHSLITVLTELTWLLMVTYMCVNTVIKTSSHQKYVSFGNTCGERNAPQVRIWITSQEKLKYRTIQQLQNPQGQQTFFPGGKN
jgi:hypothetical protein